MGAGSYRRANGRFRRELPARPRYRLVGSCLRSRPFQLGREGAYTQSECNRSASMTDFPVPIKKGRPSFRPSDEQRRMVEAMTGYGIPQQDIARVIGIHEESLRKHFRQELDTGVAKANARVAEFLFEQATGQRGEGSVTAAIFWLKTRARWKETIATEHSGPDGRPIEIIDPQAE